MVSVCKINIYFYHFLRMNNFHEQNFNKYNSFLNAHGYLCLKNLWYRETTFSKDLFKSITFINSKNNKKTVRKNFFSLRIQFKNRKYIKLLSLRPLL